MQQWNGTHCGSNVGDYAAYRVNIYAHSWYKIEIQGYGNCLCNSLQVEEFILLFESVEKFHVNAESEAERQVINHG